MESIQTANVVESLSILIQDRSYIYTQFLKMCSRSIKNDPDLW